MILNGKTALVTGAGRGIGRAIAKRFAQEGAALALCARTENELTQTQKEIADAGGKVFAKTVDVRNIADFADFIHASEKELGGIDILVNNAGVFGPGFFLKTTVDDYDNVMDTNLKTIFFACQEVIPIMQKRGGGNIINISSSIIFSHNPICYSMSKYAGVMLTKGLAKEFGPSGIRINALAPGLTATEMIGKKEDDSLARKETPLGKIASVDEIAKVALFIVSDEASHITGQVIVVDGGESLF